VLTVVNLANMTLKRLVVTDGNSEHTAGGIAVGTFDRGASLTLIDSTVTGNAGSQAPGGLGVISSTLTIVDSVISDNSSGGIGGGMDICQSTGTISGSTITGNTAGFGGGIRNEDCNGSSTLTITDTRISGNSASLGGGGIHNGGALTLIDSSVDHNSAGRFQGGGIANEQDFEFQPNATVSIWNSVVGWNTVTGDTPSSGGGGISNVSFAHPAIVEAHGLTLVGNTAPHGNGGAALNASAPGPAQMALDTTTVRENQALSGGGIFDSAAVLSLGAGTVVRDNTASIDGGGVCNTADTTFSNAGLVRDNRPDNFCAG
jgi:hypothetical protein